MKSSTRDEAEGKVKEVIGKAVNNPDLIYPNQIFQIPSAYNVDDLKDGRKMAGAPKPYLPPHAANLPADIKAELGWGF